MSILINPARFRLGADTAIGRLLGEEPAGLALDFTIGQALIRDNTTPVVNFLGDANGLLTYTAPSPKMVWDVAGLLGYAGHNLCLQSQTFDNAAWTLVTATVTANAAVAPDGTMTADRAVSTGGSGWVQQTVSAALIGTTCTFSVWLRADTPLAISLYWNGGATTSVSCNLTTAWQRFSVTAVVPAGPSVLIGGGASFTTGETIYMWGAQIQGGPVATAYLPTTTAARYGIPLDHDPVTHAPLGVLIEEQRTNLLLRSQEFNNAPWIPQHTFSVVPVVTPNAAVAPDGTLTADEVTFGIIDGPSDFSIINQNVAIAASVKIFSVWLKAKSAGDIGKTIQVYVGAGGIIDRVGHVLTADWVRVRSTGLTSTTNPSPAIGALGSDYGGGNQVAFTAYAWGAQLEVGSVATSYIPTTTAQVTRAMDNITLPAAQFPLSATAGTVAWNGDVAGTGHLWALSDGTANERYVAYLSSNVPTFIVADGGATQASLGDGSIVPPSACKLATGWALNDIAMSRDGRAVVTDTSATLPTVTSLKFGLSETNTLPLTGHIKTMKYLPRRATNAELVGMSS